MKRRARACCPVVLVAPAGALVAQALVSLWINRSSTTMAMTTSSVSSRPWLCSQRRFSIFSNRHTGKFIQAPPHCQYTPRLRPRADCSSIHVKYLGEAACHRSGASALRATVASWTAVEGEAGSNEEDSSLLQDIGDDSMQRGCDITSDDQAMDSSVFRGRGETVKHNLVLVEQEGPAWTEIVWDESNSQRVRGAVGGLQLLVKHWFIPDDVTPDYYHFTCWRMFQRFIAGTVNVFGTQALLLALGIKSRRLGAAAAMSWVLKDALGKFGRILWASKMGRRFDSDAKRWRFRSSLLYAAGNGLEIITYVFPASFLVLAAAANSFKQMSMLTSSATRNTIYRSFARGENIGDITAKGEAQIAMVDVLGMLSGIGLCTLVGTSRHSIVAAYVLLSMVDIAGIYNEIRAVVFTVLNHERTHLVVRDYLAAGSNPSKMVSALASAESKVSSAWSGPLSSERDSNGASSVEASLEKMRIGSYGGLRGVPSSRPAGVTVVGADGKAGDRKLGYEQLALTNGDASVAQRVDRRGAGGDAGGGSAMWKQVDEGVSEEEPERGWRWGRSGGKRGSATALLSSPSTVSCRENIFLSSRLSTNVFKTWSQAGLSMDGVNDLLRIFGDEHYMLVFTGPRLGGRAENSATGGILSKLKRAPRLRTRSAKGTASVILHRNATGADTVKSLLALGYLHEELAREGIPAAGASRAVSPSWARESRAHGKRSAEGVGKPSSRAIRSSGVEPCDGDSAGGVSQDEDAWEGVVDKSLDRSDTYQKVLRCLETARRRAEEGAPGLFEALESLGWSTEKFMFGNIRSRVEWRSGDYGGA